MEVQAATCTWTGAVSSDWNTIGNWSCGHVPTSSDDVVIPNVTVDPVSKAPINATSIIVESGANLTLDMTLVDIFTITSVTFTNAGAITITGNSSTKFVDVNSIFNNSGTVDIEIGTLKLEKGGTHAGSFNGNPGTYLTLGGNGITGQTFTFENSSSIKVPNLSVLGGTVNINGEFAPGFVSGESEMIIQPHLGVPSNVTINTSLTGVLLPNYINLSDALTLEDLDEGYRVPKLRLNFGGILTNKSTLEILEDFDWRGGTLTGSGSTAVVSTATFPIGFSTHYLDSHDLINQTTANWNSGTIMLTNDATFTNDALSIFNANGTTTMSVGTGTANAFINNGLFTKKTDGTTTTINTDFTNNGIVEVMAGNLIFGGDLTSGSGTTLDLGGGTLNPGETLNLSSGAELVGAGTLSSNLVNGGTVSPGSSPGIITVDGDYTQEAGGVLEIELGGDVAGTGYDQLQVTGAATLAGTLDVSLYDGFVPSNGDQFLILDAASLSGTFTTINLPTLTDGLEWQTEFTATGFTISVISSGIINGTVTYTGSTYTDPDIIIGLHSAVGEEPVKDTIISSGDSYSFEGLADGTYYISAYIDADSSGGAPDPDEPFSWYVDLNGDPEAVVITGGNTVNDVDIVLEDSPVETGVINGTVTYTGNITTTGDIIVSIHESASVDDTPIETTIADGTGAYSFENLSDGTYYVAAFLDVNDSGDGPPDDGEPFSWYVDEFGDPKAVVVSDSNTVSDVDITLEDSSFKIFLPLILK
jgi:hypothetical protein